MALHTIETGTTITRIMIFRGKVRFREFTFYKRTKYHDPSRYIRVVDEGFPRHPKFLRWFNNRCLLDRDNKTHFINNPW